MPSFHSKFSTYMKKILFLFIVIKRITKKRFGPNHGKLTFCAKQAYLTNETQNINISFPTFAQIVTASACVSGGCCSPRFLSRANRRANSAQTCLHYRKCSKGKIKCFTSLQHFSCTLFASSSFCLTTS